MNAFAGIRPKGGRNSTPLAFFSGVCSGGYLFSSGGPTPTTPPPIFTLIGTCNSVIKGLVEQRTAEKPMAITRVTTCIKSREKSQENVIEFIQFHRSVCEQFISRKQ